MTLSDNSIIQVPDYIQGLLFDCDGTLVDSMALHMEAWENTVRNFGAAFDYDFFFSKKGMKEIDIIDAYNERFNIALNPTEVVGEKHRYILQYIHHVKPLLAVVEVVHRYKNILPMAVVSGSVREIVMQELRAIGIDHCFKVILTGDDPIRQKPAPDMFLEGARLLGVSPKLCQVFEDGDLGLLAATVAGMLATDVRPFAEN